MTALAVRGWTFRGVQVFPGAALLLVNDASHSTKALVCYRDDEPVRITERR